MQIWMSSDVVAVNPFLGYARKMQIHQSKIIYSVRCLIFLLHIIQTSQDDVTEEPGIHPNAFKFATRRFSARRSGNE